MNENNSFSKRLKCAMSKSKLTLSELSNITGISKPLISNYLSGNYNAKQQNIYKISEALNVNPMWLMGYNVSIGNFAQVTNNEIQKETVKEKIEILNNDIEYLVVENENTGEIIAQITQYDMEVINPYVIRVKPTLDKKDQTKV